MVPTKASCPSPLSRHDSLSLEFKGCPWRNSHQRFQCRRAVSRGCSLGSMVNVTPRALVLLFVLCRTLFYLFFYFFARTFFPIFYHRPKGNNGLPGFNFGPSQFQNLLYLAGYDPSQPPFTKPCGSGTDCVLPYLGRVRNSPSSSRVPHRATLPLVVNN